MIPTSPRAATDVRAASVEPSAAPRSAGTRVRGRERGTAIVLVPAMTLVVIVLVGVAVDLTAVHGAQRGAQRVAAAAADDAAGLIDARKVQIDGSVVVDAEAATAYVRARVSAADLPGRVEELRIDVDPDAVRVHLVLAVPHPLLGALPGVDDERLVPVRASARLFP